MSEQPEKNQPSFDAFHVKDGSGDRSFFNRIGAAFPHKDGKGHTIALDAVPVDGRIVLRTPQDRLSDIKSEKPKQRDRAERDR